MTTSDEGVREIQLNGKQLVFLFMAVTVVSVVIFLCGVLVGRGVQRRTALVDAPVVAADDADLAPEPATPGTVAPSGPTVANDLSFNKSLDSPQPPIETLTRKPAAPSTAAAPPASIRSGPAAKPATPPPTVSTLQPAPATSVTPKATGPTPGVPGEPKGPGFAIQVAALRERGEAEGVVKRLVGKGYAAYLVSPPNGQPTIFRVRIGKFAERSAAERVATRLEREEQFKPWITR